MFVCVASPQAGDQLSVNESTVESNPLIPAVRSRAAQKKIRRKIK